MSLYQNSVTVGGLVNLPVFSNDALVPVFYSGVTYKVTMGDILSKVTKATIGLPNVNNTSDLEKPISVATQTALDGKADTVHTHNLTQIAGLNAALSLKADTGHTHSTADVTGLDAALSGKADSVHSHQLADVAGLTGILSGKADTATVTAQLLTKTDVGHTHPATDIIGLPSIPADLATETFVINAIASEPVHAHIHNVNDVTGLVGELASKAGVSHGHGISSITGLQTALDEKAATAHGHDITGVTGLQTALDQKAPASHAHSIAGVTGLQTVLDNKTDAGHPHVVGSIMDFNDGVKAVVAGYLKAGNNITLGVDVNELTVTATGTGSEPVAEPYNAAKVYFTYDTLSMDEIAYGSSADADLDLTQVFGRDIVDYIATDGGMLYRFNEVGTYRIQVSTTAKISNDKIVDGEFIPTVYNETPVGLKFGHRLEREDLSSVTFLTGRNQPRRSLLLIEPTGAPYLSAEENTLLIESWDSEFIIDVKSAPAHFSLASYAVFSSSATPQQVDRTEWLLDHDNRVFIEAVSNPVKSATKTVGINAVYDLYCDGVNAPDTVSATSSWIMDAQPTTLSAADFDYDPGSYEFLIKKPGAYKISISADIENQQSGDVFVPPIDSLVTVEINTRIESTSASLVYIGSSIVRERRLVDLKDIQIGSICWNHEFFINCDSSTGDSFKVELAFLSNIIKSMFDWHYDMSVTVYIERLSDPVAMNIPEM